MHSKAQASAFVCQPKPLPTAQSDSTQTPRKGDKEPRGWNVAPSRSNPPTAWCKCRTETLSKTVQATGFYTSSWGPLLAHPVDVVSCLTRAKQTVTFAARKEQHGLLCSEGLGTHLGSKFLLPAAICVYGCNAEKKHLWGYWVTPHNTHSSLGEGEGSWAQICIN